MPHYKQQGLNLSEKQIIHNLGHSIKLYFLIIFLVNFTLFQTLIRTISTMKPQIHPAPASIQCRLIKPQWMAQGQGARVLRVLGSDPSYLDPFLLLDFFSVKAPAGFPPHPHRGFQTVTYMRQGSFEHEDFRGHKGIINPGDIQWMTAGKGIVHSQMPAVGLNGKTQVGLGYQLWVNLKGKDKMVPPGYQEYQGENLKVYEEKNQNGQLSYRVKVIAGQWQGTKGLIQVKTPVRYLDFKLENPETSINIDLNGGWNGLLFVEEGGLSWQGGKINKNQALLFTSVRQSNSAQFFSLVSTAPGTTFVFISGQPLKEPITRRGPFVLTTQDQLMQAFRDYQGNKNGFEGANKWSDEWDLRNGHKLSQEM